MLKFNMGSRKPTQPFPALNDHEQYTVVWALREAIENKYAQLKDLAKMERSDTLYTVLGNGLRDLDEMVRIFDKICPDTVMGSSVLEFRVQPGYMSANKLNQLVRHASNPKLSLEEGMVTQLWEDGIITYQKGGAELLRRQIHPMQHGLPGVQWIGAPDWAEEDGDGKKYIYTTTNEAVDIRNQMIEALLQSI